MTFNKKLNRYDADDLEKKSIYKSNSNFLNGELIEGIFFNAADGMVIFDESGRILEVNPSFCTSVHRNRHDLIGLTLEKLVPFEMHFKLDMQAKILKEKNSVRGVLPILVKDSLSYFEFTTSTLQKDTLFLSIFRDITEKRKLEQKVRKNEELYKDLFAEALDGIIFWTEKGKIVNANESACKIFESSYDDLVSKNINDYIYSKDDKFKKMYKNLFECGAIRDELVFLMPNGQKKSLEFTTKLHAVEGYHLTILRNVSDTRRMEKELRESELKFRKVFEGAIEGIIILNNDFKIVDINQAGEKLLKNLKKDLVGHSFTEILREFQLSDDEIQLYSTDLIRKGKATGTVEVTLRSDETKFIEFAAKHNVFSEFSLITFKDITEKLEMDVKLRKSDTLHVIGELAAGIAHEIRNPMTALKGFIQLLEDNIEEDYSMYFNIITSELQRIDSIINEFLILAKPQAVKFIERDITQIMEETVKFLSAQAVLHNVQFQTYYEKDLPPIYCEQNQMKKVFINLIKNAIEVMPKGGFVTITMNSASDERIHISIQDEGCGIPKDKINKLGQPFYTTKERGTGLGLMVTYKIVEEHAGTIEVESELGVGTNFHIYLPLRKKERK
ncbi:PAS domain S-box protein [Cytobacillus dafuensis]|uniref:histidine kinase n=1 Tax=Cytobacillus dafuensis TaxID=1742359 RepID=A0A5B8Z4X1_CYTDA|nr:PAS domain S-box protein [Cytobacillus dafuensis]QED47323.1 PAS domain S-box protein [Cytobacillus dafuensis]